MRVLSSTQLRSISHRYWVAVAAVCGLICSVNQGSTEALHLSGTVQSFVESIGVNTAIDYPNTAEYHNPLKLIAAMHYLGINTLRDHTPDPNDSATWASYMAIAKAGFRFDFLIAGNGNVNISRDIAHLHAMASAQPGSILAIEAPNEINQWPITYHGLTDYRAAGATVQRNLWRAVKSDPLLSKAAVYCLTLSNGLNGIYMDEAVLGDLTSFVDYGNAHIYGSGGHNLWHSDMPYWLPVQATPTPGKPMVLTETGYDTERNAPRTDKVSELVAAKYNINLLLHNFLNGIATTYLYNLADAPSGDAQRYGQFNADWTAKAGAKAIHNLIRILTEAGSGSPAGIPNYSVEGLPSRGHSLLLAGDQAFALAVWNETTIWDATTAEDIPPSAYILTVELGSPYASVAVYDPMVGTTPIAQYGPTTTVQLHLTDHPLIIEVGHPGAAAPLPLERKHDP